MKGLFLIFHGFEAFNGISKKIRYQVKALKECGLEMHTCWLDDTDNHKRRMVDESIIADYGFGIKGKILKRIEFDSIVHYVQKENIDFIYVRYVHNASPFSIRLMKLLKKIGARIVMEIPTYPYDQEYKGLPFVYQRILFIDKCFRQHLARYVDKIVTFSDYDIIWNRPTIRISNGIDFSEIPLRGPKNDTAHSLQLIAVATMHPWHGFDRVIAGMANYYRTHTDTHDYKVYLNIVGFGVPELVDSYKKDVAKHQLEKYIIFHSALYGKELDAVFEQSDMGIGSLARHRSGIDKIKTLKNREYAARGIPFVYSETDDDFEHQPYILKAAPDDSPLDIEKVIRFYQSLKTTPLQIRMSIEQSLSWKAQMQIVINETFE